PRLPREAVAGHRLVDGRLPRQRAHETLREPLPQDRERRRAAHSPELLLELLWTRARQPRDGEPRAGLVQPRVEEVAADVEDGRAGDAEVRAEKGARDARAVRARPREHVQPHARGEARE